MADPVSNDDSTTSDGMQPSSSDPEDSAREWVLNYLNPVRDTSADIINKGLGPLSLEAINGSPLLYTNPDANFAPLRAGNALSNDTVSGSGDSDPAGDVGSDTATPVHEVVQPYTPAGSLLAGDLAHTGAVAPSLSLPVPDGVSLQRNLAVGELLNDPFVTDPRDKDAAMLALFSRGGLMDYQRTYGSNGKLNKMFIDFGNYNFGAVAAAAGYPYMQAATAAGVVNLLGSGDKSGPLFNNPRNLSFIRAGYQDYMNGILRSSP